MRPVRFSSRPGRSEKPASATKELRFSAPGTPDVDNLFARFGTGRKHFCFAGHVDVVPPGNEQSWTYPPFEGAVAQGFVYGRGASDMKGSVAAFMAAAIDFAAERGSAFTGAISLLLTCDEEGPAINGTRKVIAWLAAEGMVPDHCLLGEPTCLGQLGDTMKIGRRGSLSAAITAVGKQGHSAYPQQFDNPIPNSCGCSTAYTAMFSTAARDSSSRLIWRSPASMSAMRQPMSYRSVQAPSSTSGSIRCTAGKSLRMWIETEAGKARAEMGGRFEFSYSEPREAFLTDPNPFVEAVQEAVEDVTGLRPKLSVSGGASDAGFIKPFCPIVEFGPTNATIHQIDERISIDELLQLKAVYQAVLAKYFDAHA